MVLECVLVQKGLKKNDEIKANSAANSDSTPQALHQYLPT